MKILRYLNTDVPVRRYLLLIHVVYLAAILVVIINRWLI